ncbi:MAG: IPTL-CTERM sorting domain-containing protein [Candidatus Competibacter sp.]|nr:IPTL-CTERM sorting domain-containing protein [Candidatus Competibacter sp.]
MIQSTKRLLGLLLVLLLLPMASAFAQPDLTVGNGAGLPGATVNTDVSFTNNGAVVAMSFEITYDPTRVTPGAVTNGPALSPHSVATNIPVAGTLRVLVNPPLVNPLPNVNNGVLFTVPWTIAGAAAPGNVPLGLVTVVFSNAAAGAVPPGTLTPGQITINAPPVNVPNVVGLTQAAATTAITNAGLVLGTVTTQSNAAPAGQVISQNPAAGASVAAGSAVDIVVSLGPPPPVNVPNVVGLTQAAAATAITNAGLVVGTVTSQSDPNIPAGQVISQNPAAGASVAAGSAVNLVVSSGPARVGGEAIPTLSEWALMLFSVFLGGMIWRNRRAHFRA